MYDVAIVGGGPAGLATALHLERRGLRAVVLERRRPPVDKACGEGLMPSGVAALTALGVRPRVWAPFHGVRNLDRDRRGAIDLAARFPCGRSGWGIRRTVLHQALVARCDERGVGLRFGARVTGLGCDGVIVDGESVRARWVVGADGLHSAVRRWAGIGSAGAAGRRYGVRRHYRMRPWSPWVEVHWGPGCEAYVTPVGPDEVGVAVLFGDGVRGRFDELLACFPELRERLAGCPHGSTDRGAGPLRQRVDRVHRGRVLLVGDAAGYHDAITGEGLSLALAHAAALADALAAGRPAAWGGAHRRLDRVPGALVDAMLVLERHPRLRHRVFRALMRSPERYGRLLGLNDGSVSPRAFGLRELIALAASVPLVGLR